MHSPAFLPSPRPTCKAMRVNQRRLLMCRLHTPACVYGGLSKEDQCFGAGFINNLHVYDPATAAWTDISTAINGTSPSPRYLHGFTSAGGKLYVHGGADAKGEGGLGRDQASVRGQAVLGYGSRC